MSPVKVTPAEALDALNAAGGLIGVNASAKRLGIASPNFRRYRDRLTEVPVEGSASAFFTAEVDALADELRATRAPKDGGD